MYLPRELLDMIIDEASNISGKDESTRALTSLSLVCRAFRERAQGHLFASITTDASIQATKATQDFLGLLEADQDTETTGLASKITSFSCIVPDKGSEPLVRIWNKLFRAEDRRPCSLYLTFQCPCGWQDLPEDFAREIFQICHRPRLATLSTYRIYEIPRNFLRHSCIKRLKLDFASVSDAQLPETWFAGMTDHNVVLEYLDISVEDPILPLITASQKFDPITAFSSLQELHIHDSSIGIQLATNLTEVLMGCHGQLRILKIWLYDIDYPPISESLPKIQTLPNLHTLAVNIERPLRAPLSHIAPFLQHMEYPPNLHTIELGFCPSLSRSETGIQTCQRLGCDVLDELFAQQKFEHVRHLSLQCKLLLGFRPPRPRENFERFILSQFPLISSREDLSISVHVADIN